MLVMREEDAGMLAQQFNDPAAGGERVGWIALRYMGGRDAGIGGGGCSGVGRDEEEQGATGSASRSMLRFPMSVSSGIGW